MTRRQFVALGAGAAAVSRLPAQTVSNRVGAAQDLVCQGLEVLSSRSTPGQISQAVEFFTIALDQYESFSDAHYYRALCLKKLGQRAAMQARDMEAARSYGSEALRDGRNPFVLAVPKIYDNLAEVGEKWALVVGISKFQPDTGAPALRYADQDATAIAKMLRDPAIGRFPEKNVALLTNDGATTEAIKAKLNYIARRAKPEDIVFVSIATHGSSRSKDIKQVSYIYTYDTDVTGQDLIFGTALPMVDVANIIRTRCVAQRTVIMFDTCHSGSATPTDALSTEDLDRLRDGAGRYVVSSCQPNQSSYEGNGHGYFTSSFLDVFGSHQGCIRTTELFDAVQKNVSDTVSKVLHEAQRPVMAKSDNSSEIILGASPAGSGKSCVATQTSQS